jgi:hypothetical protein
MDIDAPGTGDDDAAVDTPPGSNAYDSDGTIAYTTMVEHLSNAGRSFDVTVYMPSTPEPHPVVGLACGSQQTADGYVPYGKRLASYGIAAVIANDAGALTNTIDVLTNFTYTMNTWMPSALAGQVDTTKLGLAGHSRGGAVSLLAAERDLKGTVVAWFGLDPVDNEFGMTPGAFARDTLPMIGIPTTYLGASVTSNCAPTADSYPMLYPKSPSPSVLIVGVGAGHTQLEDPAGCSVCTICSPSGTADGNVVLAYSVRYFTAFFARELLGDSSVGETFDGAGGPSDSTAGRVMIMSK